MSLESEVKQHLETLVKNTEGGPPGASFIAVDKTGNVLVKCAAGVRNNENNAPMTLDTIFPVWSCTKVIASIAVLKCVEDGLLNVDDPITKVLPELSDIKVLKEDGSFEEPKTPITLRHLLSHTSGLAYGFTSRVLHKWTLENKIADLGGSKEALKRPLVFHPGEDWLYGVNIDFAGQALEKVTGKTLGQYCRENIFDPLELSSLTFKMPKENVATIHQKQEDGSMKPRDYFQSNLNPDFDAGGAGLYGTIVDYVQCLVPLINDGKGHNGTQIIKPETIKEYIMKSQTDHLPTAFTKPPAEPIDKTLAGTTDFSLLGPLGHSLACCINKDELPNGRSKNSYFWSGLANLYWSADPTRGTATIFASQTLPFGNIVSAGTAMKLEGLVYKNMNRN